MAKRENDSFSIEDLMQHFIKENKLTKGMQKIKIEETWHKMMGQGVATHTTSVKLQNKTLVIQLNSSVLREELTYSACTLSFVTHVETRVIPKVLYDIDSICQ